MSATLLSVLLTGKKIVPHSGLCRCCWGLFRSASIRDLCLAHWRLTVLGLVWTVAEVVVALGVVITFLVVAFVVDAGVVAQGVGCSMQEQKVDTNPSALAITELQQDSRGSNDFVVVTLLVVETAIEVVEVWTVVGEAFGV